MHRCNEAVGQSKVEKQKIDGRHFATRFGLLLSPGSSAAGFHRGLDRMAAP
jgi:hypothetical protein